MARRSSVRRLTRRYFVYAYHPIIMKLSVSFAFLGLLVLLASTAQGRASLNELHAALSANALGAVVFLAVLFWVSTLSPFLPEFLVTVAAGFILGVGLGSVFAIGAISLAASGNFFIARRQGEHIIHMIFDLHSLREIRWTAERVTPLMVFLTWLLPSINFDLISYAGGLSRMRYPVFLGLTICGNLLSGVLLAFLGSALRSDQATIVAATLVVYTLIGTALYVRELPPWFSQPLLRND